ncbi:MAG: hypothetical protein V3U24_04615 [Candidatus Neomarinimicrobiota bacterium]
MDKSLRNISFIAVIVALIALSVTATAQETEKKAEEKKAEVATISFVTSGGGCGDAGAFCCLHHQKGSKEALEKVNGVTKVVMDAETKQICIDYEKGKLSLNELAETAKEAGHDLVLQ